MERRRRDNRKKSSSDKPHVASAKGRGILRTAWIGVKNNVKGLADAALFGTVAGLLYAFGDKLGALCMEQLPTEESTRTYYQQLLAESRGGAA